MGTCAHPGCSADADKKYCQPCFLAHYKGKKSDGAADPSDTTTPTAKPAEEKKESVSIGSIEVHKIGACGKYSFSIQALSNKGKGMKERVQIIEGDKAMTTRFTDDRGFFEFTAQEFTELEREYVFKVVGSQIQCSMKLPGPKKVEQPKEKVVPIKGAGFWANVRNVLNNE